MAAAHVPYQLGEEWLMPTKSTKKVKIAGVSLSTKSIDNVKILQDPPPSFGPYPDAIW